MSQTASEAPAPGNYLIIHDGDAREGQSPLDPGSMRDYCLDDRLSWELGRPSKGNAPDIALYCASVSRRQGRVFNVSGCWFYMDHLGKNGTVHLSGWHLTRDLGRVVAGDGASQRRIRAGIGGRIKPILLQDGDILIFGGPDAATLNQRSVWARFMVRR